MDQSADRRGVSEIYGTVLILSLAFLTAFMLIVVGTVVLDELQGETEESLSQDAMQVMDDRLAGITGGDINASTEFQFPDGDGEVRAMPEEGVMTVEVEASNFPDSYFDVDESPSSTRVEMGTIEYRTTSDAVTVWQGGALFERDRGATQIVSAPPLNYDGTVLSIPMVNLTDAGHIPEGQPVSAHLDATSSAETSAVIRDQFSRHWTVVHGGVEFGTDQVDVRITIQSDYVDGWTKYAVESMTTPPDLVEPAPDQITRETDEVTFYFFNVGQELSNELQTNNTDWSAAGRENFDVIYSGNSSYAIFNNAIEPAGDAGFVINKTAAADELASTAGAQPTKLYVAVFFFDEADYAIYDEDNDVWIDTEGSPLDPESLAILEHQLGDFSESITDATGELDGHEGEWIYDFDGPQAICVYSSNSAGGFTSAGDIADRIEEDCGDTFAIEGDPITLAEGPTYEIDDATVEVDGVEMNRGDEVAVEDGETISVTAEINNTGDIAEEQSVFLQADRRTIAVEAVSVDPGDTEVVTLTYAVDGEALYFDVGTAFELRVRTAADRTPPSAGAQYHFDVEWEPATPDVSLSLRSVEVEYPHTVDRGDGPENAINPEETASLVVSGIVINEDDRDSGQRLVTLQYWHLEEQTYRTVATDTVSVEALGAEDFELEWNTVNDDGNLLDEDELEAEVDMRVVVVNAEKLLANVLVHREAT